MRRSSSIKGRAYASPMIVIMLARSRAAVARIVRHVEARGRRAARRWHPCSRPGTPSTARRRASAARSETTCRRRPRRGRGSSPRRRRRSPRCRRRTGRPGARAPPWGDRWCRRCTRCRCRRARCRPRRGRLPRRSLSKSTAPGIDAASLPSSSSTSTSRSPRALRAHPEQRREPALVHHAARAEHAEQLGDLGRGVLVVDVARHDARPPAPEDRLDVLGPVVHQHRDAVLTALPVLEVGALAVQPQPCACRCAASGVGAGRHRHRRCGARRPRRPSRGRGSPRRRRRRRASATTRCRCSPALELRRVDARRTR